MIDKTRKIKSHIKKVMMNMMILVEGKGKTEKMMALNRDQKAMEEIRTIPETIEEEREQNQDQDREIDQDPERGQRIDPGTGQEIDKGRDHKKTMVV